HAKHANYENLDDHIWSDNNIDERASDYFAVLLTAGKNINVWKPSGRTIYVGGSKRTQKRKKAELKKAAQNTRPITAYLAPVLTSSNVALASTSTFGLSTELCAPTEVGSELMEVESIEVELVESMEAELVESIEAELVESVETELVELMETELVELMEAELVESIEMELVESMKMELLEPTADASAEIDEKTKMRLAIEELDRLLKTNDNQIDKGVRVRLQASLQYLRLRYYHDQTKIRASTMIASSLGWGDYKARCIGAWAQNWLKWRKLPKDNRGKFTKVSSLLDDERISMKELDPVFLEYDDQDLTKLVEKNIHPEKKKHCVITHDETMLAANDDEKTGWGPKGRVHLTEEQHAAHPEISKCYVTELLEIEANYEGYWNVQLLAKQLEWAIDILEIALPDTILVFGFDNSSSHGAFTEDVLIVNRMNVGYSGKQPKMHLGRFSDGTFQEMEKIG
ncbi:8518_t:CDS:2, partial [Racocetra fulgida]